LTTISPLLGQERPQPRRLARYDRRRAEVGVLQHRQLLVLFPQPARIVDDRRRAARPLEQQRGEVIVEVERGILAHQHRVAALERHGALLSQQVVIADDAADGHGPGARDRIRVLERQVARFAEPDVVAACLRRQHDGERRVARDLQARQRVHDEQKFHVPSEEEGVGTSFIGKRCSSPCLRIR
jgi:hypothetical protein